MARSPAGRMFESALPATKRMLPARPPRTSDYQRLMRVSIENTYYCPPFACSDFTIAPTAASSKIMLDLGLLFLPERSGFSLLYDANETKSLFTWLKSRRNPRNGKFESRLSFALSLDNPVFQNFTNVPVNWSPEQSNFYFSNQNAHRAGRLTVLTTHRYVRRGELVRLVPGQLGVPVELFVDRVEVLNIFGDVVMCLPRCVPAALAAAMDRGAITCGNVAAYLREKHEEPVKWECRNTIYVDFASLPEDRYVIREERWLLPPRETTVLYGPAGGYAFIDLLFSIPEPAPPSARGIYPVNGLDGPDPFVTPVDYHVVFRRRSTYWRYYVVLPPRRRHVSGLTIETEPQGAVTFTGPIPVIIATATHASLFISDQPVPLSQKPPARFILQSDDGILMRSMPIASTDQILPEEVVGFRPSPPRFRDYSDIYVHV